MGGCGGVVGVSGMGRGRSQGAAGRAGAPVPDSRGRPAGRPLPDTDRQGGGHETGAGSSRALIIRGAQGGPTWPGPGRFGSGRVGPTRATAGWRGPRRSRLPPFRQPVRPGPARRGLGAVATPAAGSVRQRRIPRSGPDARCAGGGEGFAPERPERVERGASFRRVASDLIARGRRSPAAGLGSAGMRVGGAFRIASAPQRRSCASDGWRGRRVGGYSESAGAPVSSGRRFAGARNVPTPAAANEAPAPGPLAWCFERDRAEAGRLLRAGVVKLTAARSGGAAGVA